MQRFTATDGATIAYRDRGHGRPILLLHGLMAHSGFFTPQYVLADDHRLISVDFRGHGAALDADEPTIERLAQDVAELSEALALEQAVVVGWSLGASVLWHLLTGPAAARFAGGIVIDMTPRVMNGPDWDLGLTPERCADRLDAMRSDYPAFATAAGEAIFSPDFADEMSLKAWAGREFARNDGQAIAALWTSLVEQDVRDRLRRIAQPVIVVHGGRSHLYGPDTARYLAAEMPNARTVEFPDCGHSPHLEAPESFNKLVLAFEAGLPAFTQNMITEAGER